jgi:hypothetical protein
MGRAPSSTRALKASNRRDRHRGSLIGGVAQEVLAKTRNVSIWQVAPCAERSDELAGEALVISGTPVVPSSQ